MPIWRGKSCRMCPMPGWTTAKHASVSGVLRGTSVPNIHIHIRNILEENELRAEATVKQYLIVRRGGSRQVERPVKTLQS